MSRYKLFDRSQLKLGDLDERGHDLTSQQCLPLEKPDDPYADPQLDGLAERIVAARLADRPVIVMMGAHPIKLGLSRFLVDLVRRRIITHLGTNGAGLIHDFELAAHGGTSEDVARWIRVGKFGLWRQTSRLNDLAVEAADRGEGFGETVGRVIHQEQPAGHELSLAAGGWRAAVPVTCHLGIGCDIIHAHPNCDPAALATASYTDFLIFVRSVADLEGGVFLNLGTSTIGPEVYLKALSMVRNVACAKGTRVRDFTTAVFDLVDLPADWSKGPPSKTHPLYYYRPWKTILIRTVADGGTSFYFRGDHRQTIPTLWSLLVDRVGSARGGS